jgi:nucleotide-binding universal stress UspA family protein
VYRLAEGKGDMKILRVVREEKCDRAWETEPIRTLNTPGPHIRAREKRILNNAISLWFISCGHGGVPLLLARLLLYQWRNANHQTPVGPAPGTQTMEVAMLAIRRILHPTDFTERSENAFRLACALARDHGASLLVLHVQAPVAIYGDGLMTAPLPGYTEGLRTQLMGVRAYDPRVTLEHKLVEGDPAGEILQVARETGCDLIVMGTHGRTGLRRMLMGSVAEEVVRKSSCPVLTVKTPFLIAEAPAPSSKAEVAHS